MISHDILEKFVTGKFQLGYITEHFCDICGKSPFLKQCMLNDDSKQSFLLNICGKCEMETSMQRREFKEKMDRISKRSTKLDIINSVLRRFWGERTK